MESDVPMDFPEAIWDQPRTLVERLRLSEKQPVTVYVAGVHVGMGGPPGSGMAGTMVLHGLLAYVGEDYVDVHVPMPGGNIREVLVPIAAVGAILPGGPIV
ncbi:MAG TPA: hypothetical protein GX510_06065 [Firmicutes bacterium]|nr:hypothetical protein [Candidatus Fermentithermobacillaceae bacterium]